MKRGLSQAQVRCRSVEAWTVLAARRRFSSLRRLLYRFFYCRCAARTFYSKVKEEYAHPNGGTTPLFALFSIFDNLKIHEIVFLKPRMS